MLALTDTYEVTWEKLPDDFVLDDDPVDNINQLLDFRNELVSGHMGRHPR